MCTCLECRSETEVTSNYLGSSPVGNNSSRRERINVIHNLSPTRIFSLANTSSFRRRDIGNDWSEYIPSITSLFICYSFLKMCICYLLLLQLLATNLVSICVVVYIRVENARESLWISDWPETGGDREGCLDITDLHGLHDIVMSASSHGCDIRCVLYIYSVYLLKKGLLCQRKDASQQLQSTCWENGRWLNWI